MGIIEGGCPEGIDENAAIYCGCGFRTRIIKRGEEGKREKEKERKREREIKKGGGWGSVSLKPD